MLSSTQLLLLSNLAGLAMAEFGLGVQLFMLSGEAAVNNVKLDWDTSTTPSATYEVVRSNGTASSFQSLATVTGNTFDDYGLPSLDESYVYQITAMSGGSSVDQSNTASIQPFSPTGSYRTYDNMKLSQLLLKPNLTSNGVYYQFLYGENANGSMSGITQRTSTDGVVCRGSWCNACPLADI